MHINGNHWALSLVDIEQRIIKYYDSMKESEMDINIICSKLENVFNNFIRDDRAWMLIDGRAPRQGNSYDCGVFVCRFMSYLSRGEVFDFEQSDMEYFRKMISVELLTGELLV